jgi:hypothetical protein
LIDCGWDLSCRLRPRARYETTEREDCAEEMVRNSGREKPLFVHERLLLS